MSVPPPTADYLFQFAIFLSSVFAAVFWFCSATGKTVVPPWRKTEDVPPEDYPAHQAKWNALAAAMTGLTAVFQGIQLLYNNPLFHFSSLSPP